MGAFDNFASDDIHVKIPDPFSLPTDDRPCDFRVLELGDHKQVVDEFLLAPAELCTH